MSEQYISKAELEKKLVGLILEADTGPYQAGWSDAFRHLLWDIRNNPNELSAPQVVEPCGIAVEDWKERIRHAAGKYNNPHKTVISVVLEMVSRINQLEEALETSDASGEVVGGELLPNADWLLPCPFCGGTSPEVRSNGIGDYYVICDGDDETERHCGAATSDRRCETEKGAIDRWNTRPTAAQGGLVGLLKECVEELEESIQNEGRLASFSALIAKIKAALSASPVAGWIAVSERLPEFNEFVIVWCGWSDYGVRTDDEQWASTLGFRSEDGDPIFHVTHWMLLPPQPATAEGGEET